MDEAINLNKMLQVVFSLTVNSEPEDTGELVSVARVLRDAGRVRGPDTETRRGLVNNIVNVCANLEGKEVQCWYLLSSMLTSVCHNLAGTTGSSASAHSSHKSRRT